MTFLNRTGIYFCILLLLSLLFAGNADAQVTNPAIAKNTIPASKKDAVVTAESPSERPAEAPSPSIYDRVGTDQTQTISLSLAEAIRMAVENNNDIEVSRDNVRLAETSYRSLLGSYDPVFTFVPKYSRSSTTGSSASNDLRADSSFSKLLKSGGGNYNVFFNTSQTGTNSQNNQNFNQTSSVASGSGTTYFSALGFSYNQPLLRNFKIDSTRQQIKVQRKRVEQSEADFQRQTIDTVNRVQKAYWDLVFSLRDQQNKVANLNLAKENLRRVEASIAAGKSAPLERAEVSTELANREADVLVAAQQVSIAENALKVLLLRDPASSQWGNAVVPVDQPIVGQDPLNMDASLKEAIAARPELTRLRLESEINQVDLDFFKNQIKPKIDINSSFSLEGLSLGKSTSSLTPFPIITPGLATNADSYLLAQVNTLRASLLLPPLTLANIPTVTPTGLPSYFSGGTMRSLQNLFRSDAPNFSIGVTISFPLHNKTAKANLAGAQIQQNQIQAQTRQQEQAVIVEVRNAVQAVETARQRVVAARKGRENAEIQLNGERKLFDVGRSTTFLLFQRENALTNARNAEIRAETDYTKAVADLQRSTAGTLKANNIQIASPISNK